MTHLIERRHFEIGRILHLKSEIRNLKLDWQSCPEPNGFSSPILNFGFEVQDSSNFEISSSLTAKGYAATVSALWGSRT